MRVIQTSTHSDVNVSRPFVLDFEPTPVVDDVPQWGAIGCTLTVWINVDQPGDQLFDVAVEGSVDGVWGNLIAATEIPATFDRPGYRPKLKYRSTTVDADQFRVVIAPNEPTRFSVDVEVT